MAANLIEQDGRLTDELREGAVSAETHPESPTNNAKYAPPSIGKKVFWRRIVFAALFAAGIFAVGWWTGAGRARRSERIMLPESVANSNRDKLVVTVEPIARRIVRRSIQAVGTLHGYEELTISAKTDGRVTKIYHDLSSRLKPGELLLEVDPTDAQLAVNQAERSVQAELAKWGFTHVPSQDEDLSNLPTVVSARLKYELMLSRLERVLALQKTNSIALEDVEQAKSDARVLESDWRNQLLMAQSAAATVRLRNAELDIAKQKLADTKIYAPTPTMYPNDSDQYYSVTERLVSEGTLLRPGSEVFKVVLGKTLKLRLAVPESFSNGVGVGQHVEVETFATDVPVIGTVARISPSIDRATRAFQVEVEIANLDGALKPGGFAKAKIFTAVDENATTIPSTGVYSFAGIIKIFLEENGVARELHVTLGERVDDWTEIVSPPMPDNARVITSGQRLLSDGIAVTIRSTQPSDASEKPELQGVSSGAPQ
jgi:RND family efflux transporter MFP subunit